jgi:uncharacterized protein YndB with AHSA1/START domain
MDVTYSLEINAPIEQAFDCVNDEDKIKQWAQGVEEIIHLEPWNPDRPVGSRFKQKIREGGRLAEYEGEIVAYDKPAHLAITLGSRAFTMRVDYRFSRVTDTSTRLDYAATMIQANLLARIMGVAFGWMTRRILTRQMTALKALAEGDARDGR